MVAPSSRISVDTSVLSFSPSSGTCVIVISLDLVATAYAPLFSVGRTLGASLTNSFNSSAFALISSSSFGLLNTIDESSFTVSTVGCRTADAFSNATPPAAGNSKFGTTS